MVDGNGFLKSLIIGIGVVFLVGGRGIKGGVAVCFVFHHTNNNSNLPSIECLITEFPVQE